MAGSSRRFIHGAIALVALCGAVVATTTAPAEAVTSYVNGVAKAVTVPCPSFSPPFTPIPTQIASTSVDVQRNDAVAQPKATTQSGTVNTFYVRVRVTAVFQFICQASPFVPQFTLPAGVHLDTSAAFAVLCKVNGVELTSNTPACPGKANLVTPVAGGPTSYRRSVADPTWALTATPLTADTYEFQFPVYADRIFVDRQVVASVTMAGATAVPSVVQAAVFRPAMTCDGKAVTVETQFGEKSTDANDVISGGPGNDKISGGFGNDLICGGAGNDVIDGGPGNDIVNGGLGNDVMSGGTGVDTVDYTANSAVKVNLGLLVAQNTVGAGVDTVGDFENIIGSAGADTLTGNAVRNVLDGRNGNDNLIAGPGNDSLLGGVGTDRCDGGTGTDTATLCETRLGIP